MSQHIINIQDLTTLEFLDPIVFRKGLTMEKLLNVLITDGFLVQTPGYNNWYDNLVSGCVVFMPRFFKVALNISEEVYSEQAEPIPL